MNAERSGSSSSEKTIEIFGDLKRKLSQNRDPLAGVDDLEQVLAIHRAERSSSAEAPDRSIWVVRGSLHLRCLIPRGDSTQFGGERQGSANRGSRRVDCDMLNTTRRHRKVPHSGQRVRVIRQPRLNHEPAGSNRQDSPPAINERRCFLDACLGADRHPLVPSTHFRAPGDENDTERAIQTQAIADHLAIPRLENVKWQRRSWKENGPEREHRQTARGLVRTGHQVFVPERPASQRARRPRRGRRAPPGPLHRPPPGHRRDRRQVAFRLSGFPEVVGVVAVSHRDPGG